MSANSEQVRRKFHTLDGMRGVAALLVITRHGQEYFAPLKFPNNFLAVDLFFMLSGFVVAAAYEQRLATRALSPIRFTVIRLIRLYPLYILGTLIGLPVTYFKVLHGKSYIDLHQYWLAFPTHLLMLPSPATPLLFVGNVVAWSLTFELLANVVYAFWHGRMSSRALGIIASLALLAMLFGLGVHDGLNNGWSWRYWWIGLARVSFAFPVGILMFRNLEKIPKIKLSPLAVLGLLAINLIVALPGGKNDVYQIISIALFFPILMMTAVRVEPSQRLIPLFTWLGVTSYAVYTIHLPFLTLIEWALSKVHVVYSDYSPWSGFAGMMVILLIAWIADRVYDIPVRAWLTRRTLSRFTSIPGRSERIVG